MSSSYNAITGTDTANTLIASNASDDIKALSGDDTISEVFDKDIVDLGGGNDKLTGKSQDVADFVSVLGGLGKDTIEFTHEVRYSTLKGGGEDDRISIKTNAFATRGNYIYGDQGNDSLTIPEVRWRDKIYGGNITDATSNDGDDSIYISGGIEKECLVHGNGGNDTISFDDAKGTEANPSSIYGGQGNDSLFLNTTLSHAYLTGNIGDDTIALVHVPPTGVGNDGKINQSTIFGGGGYLVDTSNDGSDSIRLFTPKGISRSLLHGNGGNDTINVNGVVSTVFDNSNDMYETSIYGGQGDDSILAHHPVSNGFSITSSLITGNRGNDTIYISGAIVTTSIYGGHGDNHIRFGHGFDKSGNETNTYYFGSDTGNDTLDFSQVHTSGGLRLTVAVDSSLGVNPLAFQYDTSEKKISLGSSGKSIFVNGYTGTRTDNINSLGLTFTTVSSSVITSLG